MAQVCPFEIAGARAAARGQQAAQALASDGLDVEVVEIDLNDEKTIASAAQAIDDRQGRLDILVNNAGIVDAQDGPPPLRASMLHAGSWKPMSSARLR
ncbi:SDR family NAD(P)-dependent oxidoreductase [Pelagibacterium nitratireducens]|uniref:SDR family NAD(P)-dependent oxidoreductase n=1 Tax=Pelagibacterium nitratireducens TaxID=1046114 RepID=A0ABZ2IC73_9HYPH